MASSAVVSIAINGGVVAGHGIAIDISAAAEHIRAVPSQSIATD